MLDHLEFSFCLSLAYGILQRASLMTLDGVADTIKMLAFTGEAEHDLFSSGQTSSVGDWVECNVGEVRHGSSRSGLIWWSRGSQVSMTYKEQHLSLMQSYALSLLPSNARPIRARSVRPVRFGVVVQCRGCVVHIASIEKRASQIAVSANALATPSVCTHQALRSRPGRCTWCLLRML